MPIFDNSTQNTPESALTYRALATRSVVNALASSSVLWAIITGKQVPDAEKLKWERLQQPNSYKVDVPIMGQSREVFGVPRGAPERAAVVPTGVNGWGTAEFELAHYVCPVDITDSDKKFLLGADRPKVKSILGAIQMQVRESYKLKLTTDINATGAGVGPTGGNIGSWVHAVSDGLNTGGVDESAYKMYGTIDRSLAENDFHRSIVDRTGGALTLGKLNTNELLLSSRGVEDIVGITGVAMYAKLKDLVDAKGETVIDGKWSKLGAKRVQYGGVAYYLEPKCPSGTIGLIDPESFIGHMEESGIDTTESMQRDVTRLAMWIWNTQAWFGNFCKAPRNNAKLVGLT